MQKERPMRFFCFLLMTTAMIPITTGCGGDDDTEGDGGAGSGSAAAAPANYTASTGVEGSKAIKDLSSDERQALCDAGKEHLLAELGDAETQAALCTLSGLLLAAFTGNTTPEACEEGAAECKASGGFEVEDGDCALQSADADCAVTVDELEACADETIAGVKSLVGTLRDGCALADDQEALQALFAGQQSKPPACAAIDTKCPGISGND
jgi:hypothetical protein